MFNIKQYFVRERSVATDRTTAFIGVKKLDLKF